MAMKKLGKYEILEELGRGGFGTVYRARDTALDVERAVKVLHPALVAAPEFIERFRREAKIAACLDHPNIVPVYEFGEDQGFYYLAMKYLPGGSLKDVLARGGRLPFERAVEITRQIAAALEYAYSQPKKLIHRDIKPGNILFDANPLAGAGGTAHLADFGFAKALAGVSSSSLSSSGGMIGTPPYMPPEVWRRKGFTPATDVYCLACVFFEMIAGEVLFDGDSPADIMTRHVLDGPQFPEQWPEGVPEGIETVLGKALAKEPKERYQSMGEFAAALESLLAGSPLPARSPLPSLGEGPGVRATRPPRMDDSMATIEQDESQETRRQEATRDEVEKKPAPVGRDSTSSYALPKKRAWWPWVIGIGTLAIGGALLVALIVVSAILIGNSGISKPVPTTFLILTSAHTPSNMQIPSITFVPTLRNAPGISPSKTPTTIPTRTPTTIPTRTPTSTRTKLPIIVPTESPPLQGPILLSPANGSTISYGSNITFQWSEVPGAIYYTIGITYYYDGNWDISAQQTSQTTYSLIFDSHYTCPCKWSVGATDSSYVIHGSDEWSFELAP